MTDPSISAGGPPDLSLDLRLDEAAGAAGAAVLTNRGASEVRIWRLGSTWGDDILSFEADGPERRRMLLRQPQRYTVNVPVAQAVPAGGEYLIPFDLNDGGWEPGVPANATSLTAVLEIPNSPEARLHQVWTGRLRSDPVPLG